MDFVTGVPQIPQGFNTIWVIVDRFTKTALSLPIRLDYSMDKLSQLYI